MALSVILLLFMILESGLGGDPSLRMAGSHPSPQRIAEARLHLGIFEQLESNVAKLRLQGKGARVYLDAPDADQLRFLDIHQNVLLQVPVPQQELGEFLYSLDQLELSPGLWLQVAVDSSFTASDLDAAGIAHALDGLRLTLDNSRSTPMAWALPRPAWRRFFAQTRSLLCLDFGRSLEGQSIATELTSRGLRSLALTFPAMLLSTLAALFAAMWMASRKGLMDRGFTAVCTVGMAITSLAWILFLRNVFAGNLGWFPVAGWDTPFWNYLALPILIWALLVFFPSFLLYRALFLQQKGKAHFQTAKAKGLSGRGLLTAHLARPAAASLISQWVLMLPFLVTGSLLLERIFVIPGLGSYVVDAAINGDSAILRSVTFLMALLYIAFQWIGDWLTAWIDPRTRAEVNS